MKIKTTAIVLLLMIYGAKSFSQFTEQNRLFAPEAKVKIEKVNILSDYLILGTLNDYLSRKWQNGNGEFDRYYDAEKPLMMFIDSIVKRDFNIQLVKYYDHYISKEMKSKMDSFYNGTNLIDSVLYANDDRKLSFLTGIYLRFGEKIDGNLYRIQLANSAKQVNCYAILNQLHCKNIYYKHLDNFPSIDIFYFQATPLMVKYFDEFAATAAQILEARISYIYRKSTNPMADYLKVQQEKSQKIKTLFSIPL